MTTAPPRRLFVALWPPPDFVAELAADLGEIGRAAPATVRWQPPERWHITLLFLGDASRRRAEKALAEVAATSAGGVVTCGGSGHFGRTLWLGVTAPWTSAVHTRLAQLTGHRPEHRWRPHLTLARSRGAPIPPETLAAVGELPVRDWFADRLVLVDSTIGPTPSYRTVAEVPLTGPSHR